MYSGVISSDLERRATSRRVTGSPSRRGDSLGNRSDAQNVASRENGKKGGRPRDDRYAELFAELEDPPKDPFEVVTWMQQIVAAAAKETAQGRGNKSLNQEFRAFAGVVSRLVPLERIHLAEKVILGATLPTKPTTKPGPPMESRLGKPPALRREV